MEILKEQVRTYCRSLGFSLVSFSAPEKAEHFSKFQEWVKKGHQAGMQYLSSEHALFLRENPRNLMPSCQTILILAYPYLPIPLNLPLEKKAVPMIAAYACRKDYHVFLPPLLERIIEFIRDKTGDPIQSKYYTDSGPLLERELACQAGMGWIGKNSCLIHEEIGSFFFLSEILLDVPLIEKEPKQPIHPDRCGTCQRCIDACPTRCIQADRTLDSRRCISYLTIENKGEIPIDLRPLIGDHLFGCDICQQVCPWNQKILALSKPGEMPLFLQTCLQNLDPAKIMEAAEFKRIFADYPILRAKRSGFYRNLAVVLGNQKNTDSIPLLSKLLTDPDALIRQHAAWALGCFHSGSIKRILEDAFVYEKDERVKQEIILAVKK